MTLCIVCEENCYSSQSREGLGFAPQAIFTATDEPIADLDAECTTLKEAMDGWWSTDEAALIKVICPKTPAQMVPRCGEFAFSDGPGRMKQERVTL